MRSLCFVPRAHLCHCPVQRSRATSDPQIALSRWAEWWVLKLQAAHMGMLRAYICVHWWDCKGFSVLSMRLSGLDTQLSVHSTCRALFSRSPLISLCMIEHRKMGLHMLALTADFIDLCSHSLYSLHMITVAITEASYHARESYESYEIVTKKKIIIFDCLRIY